MLRTRIKTCILALLLGAAPVAFSMDIVTINGVRVDASTLIAKVRQTQPGSGQLQALALPNTEVKDRFHFVPGLVTLKHSEQAGTLQAMSQEQKAAALLDWMDQLKQSGQFEYVELNVIRQYDATPNDLRFQDGTLWSLQNTGQNGGLSGADISAPAAWDLTTGSTNVIVAVIDSGVRYTHHDLEGQMWHNPGEIPGNGIDDDNDGFIDDVYGADPFDNDGDPMDDVGHGTHVAGTIGAAANNGYPHVGIAWNVQIMAIKIGNEDGLPASAELRGLEYAGTHGAKIINASYGGYAFSQAEFDAMNELRRRGVLIVAAAGNESNDNDANPSYPASYKLDNIISVAATDRRDLKADFSNFGATTVHLGAPGVEIFSTYFNSDTDYTFLQGTSMATPHVVGVAALVASYLPGTSYSDIKARILQGVTKIPSLAGKTITGGRLNAFKALNGSTDGILEYSIIPASNSFVTIGRSLLFSVSLSDGPTVTNATVALTGSGVTLPLKFDVSGTNTVPSATAGTYTNTYLVPNIPGPLNFTLTASAPGKTNLNVPLTYQAVNRPINDDFANAIKVPAVTSWLQETSNRLATIEGPAEQALQHGGAADASASIWYSWTVRERTPVIVDTAGSSFNAAIGVYTGTALTNLQEVAAARQLPNAPPPWVKFTAEPNISYKIAIAGVGTNSEGTVRVRFELNGEPDTVAPIVEITDPPVSGLTTNVAKVTISGTARDPGPNTSGIQEKDVQYIVRTNRAFSAEATAAAGSTNWTAIVNLNPGVNFITVYAFDAAKNRSLEKEITMIYQEAPINNDLFVMAQDLDAAAGSGSISASNTNATKEAGEPPHGGNQGGRSLWYKFTAPSSGVLLVDTRGSLNAAGTAPLDTVLSVYTSTNTIAPRVNTLRELASSDDVVGAGVFSEATVTVQAGQTYYIGVDGYDAAAGTVQLNYTFNAAPIHFLTILPSGAGLGSATPGSAPLGNPDQSIVYPFPENSTVSIVASPRAGYQFDYFETPQGNSSQNPLTVVMSGDITVRPFFRVKTFAEDFEGGFHLPFTSTNWFISLDPAPATDGNHVFLSSGAGRDRITNTTSVIIRAADGVGSFRFRVSTEPTYDQLQFFITPLEGTDTNRILLGSWSGEASGTFPFSLNAGRVRLEWRYVKDIAFSEGSDEVYIDDLDLPLASGQAGLTVDGQSVALKVAGLAGQSVIVEGSGDLVNWTVIGTAVADENGAVQISEPKNASHRFYRFTPQFLDLPK